MRTVRIEPLPNTGDHRGDFFKFLPDLLPELGMIDDIHFGIVNEGCVRGNHFHERNREVLLVWHESDWELYWQDIDGGAIERSSFSGVGAEVMVLEPRIAHAIRNSGTKPLRFVSLAPSPYDLDDRHRLELVTP